MNYQQAFEKRLRDAAAEPLLTWYDVSSGARVELSARTFGNWIDKTVYLLADEVDLQPGDTVAIPLLEDRPQHWMTLVLVATCWHLGATVTIEPDAATTALVIGGPTIEADPDQIPTWAVSLHPLGMGLSDVAPGVLDWAGEVRGYPDAHQPPVPVTDELAWSDPPVRFDQLHADHAESRRVLVRATDPWTTVRAALVTPVLTGGSAVLVEGPASAEELQLIAAEERVTV